MKKPIAFFLDCTKPTYCPTACIELSRNAELQINYSSEELTCKKSSENLRRYLPFGELFVEQRATANYYTPYKFSGKEKDEETSYSYFGARYYMSDVSTWLSVDPLADQAPSWTPYRYCFQNPIRIIDPNGMSEGLPDHYFSTDGEWLGDDKKGDNVRIISRAQFNMYTENGTKVEENADILKDYSVLFSDANISDETMLKIYNFYNTTGLPVFKDECINGDKKGVGLLFEAGVSLSGRSAVYGIGIALQGNKASKLFDDYFNITNSFDHEDYHKIDFLRSPLNFYQSSTSSKELRAINYQKNQPSWRFTTESYQKSILEYEKSFLH